MSLISLGTAASYAVIAYSTITSTGNCLIYGDMGIFPGSAYTGFPPSICYGDIYAATADASTAKADALLAYQDAASQTVNVTMTNIDLAGLTLTRGVYKWDDAAALSSGDLYLDAEGDEDAVWIFQIGSSLNIASGSSIFFTSGLGNQDNVFWQVGSLATINTGVAFIGNILAHASISVATGSTVDGHLVALNEAVTLDTNTVSVAFYPSPAPSMAPTLLPSLIPSPVPTAAPSITVSPSLLPSSVPTAAPSSTASPSLPPSPVPTASPSLPPSPVPTTAPSLIPFPTPTAAPSFLPSPVPTAAPSLLPFPVPTPAPTLLPSSPSSNKSSTVGLSGALIGVVVAASVVFVVLSVGTFMYMKKKYTTPSSDGVENDVSKKNVYEMQQQLDSTSQA